MVVPTINFNQLGEHRFDLKIPAQALFASQAVENLDPHLQEIDEEEVTQVQTECDRLHQILDSQFSWKMVGGSAVSAIVLSIGLFKQSLRWGIPGLIGCALFSLRHFVCMNRNSQMYAKIDQDRIRRLREKVIVLDEQILATAADAPLYSQLQKVNTYFKSKLPTS